LKKKKALSFKTYGFLLFFDKIKFRQYFGSGRNESRAGRANLKTITRCGRPGEKHKTGAIHKMKNVKAKVI
jgi:hypothetical protein